MFENKKIATLAEDFKALGLIKDSADRVGQEKLNEENEKINTRRREIIRKRKLAEQKKLKAKKAARRLAEAKKNKVRVKSESKRSAIDNLKDLENRLKTGSSLDDIVKAFENIKSISKLASSKFAKLSEQDATDYDGKKQKAQGKEAGKDKLDINDKEGNVGYDSDDEQEGGQAPKAVAGTTGKYAGQPAHMDPNAQKVKIAEMDEIEDEDEVDVMDTDLSDEDEIDIEMDMDDDDSAELELDIDDEPMDDVDVAADDIEMEPADDDEMDMSDELEDEPDIEIDMSDDEELGDEEFGDEEMDDEEADDEEMSLENKRFGRSVYISELKNIRLEAEDILKKIKKHAISPQDAEGVLKDVVMRLGGAIGDLADMGKYSVSDKEHAV